MPTRLDPQQQRVLNAFLRRARQQGASPKKVKALVEAGITEAGLHNPNYGDRDSIGSLQERSTYGSAARRLDPSRAAKRFLEEAAQLDRPQYSAGELAQAVQRSAFPGRYDQHSAEADALLQGKTATAARKGGSSSRSVTTSRTIPGVDNSEARNALILNFLQQRHNPQALVALASGLKDAQDTPAVKAYSTKTVKGSAASGARVASGSSPTARGGKLIGTPYSGTHTLGNWQSDRAYDIGVPEGTPMVALQDGVVVKVTKHPQGSGRFAGDQITIRGKNGNEYFYAHGVASVQPGQRVRKGQKLGVTGSANGVAHLHFAQKKGDPSMHLRGDR